MEDSERNRIFSHLDSPVKFLCWTKGELLLILGPFFFGILLNIFVLGVATCALNSWGISVYKQRFGKGKLQALRYKYFPPSQKLRCFPPSYILEFVG